MDQSFSIGISVRSSLRRVPRFFLFLGGDARVKQQTVTYITMNGINTVARVISVERKRRQRLFRAKYQQQRTSRKQLVVLAHCRLQSRSCV